MFDFFRTKERAKLKDSDILVFPAGIWLKRKDPFGHCIQRHTDMKFVTTYDNLYIKLRTPYYGNDAFQSYLGYDNITLTDGKFFYNSQFGPIVKDHYEILFDPKLTHKLDCLVKEQKIKEEKRLVEEEKIRDREFEDSLNSAIKKIRGC